MKSWCKNNSLQSDNSISCTNANRNPIKLPLRSVQTSDERYFPSSLLHGLLSYPIPTESHPILAAFFFSSMGTANVPHPKNSALYPSYPIWPLRSNSWQAYNGIQTALLSRFRLRMFISNQLFSIGITFQKYMITAKQKAKNLLLSVLLCKGYWWSLYHKIVCS